MTTVCQEDEPYIKREQHTWYPWVMFFAHSRKMLFFLRKSMILDTACPPPLPLETLCFAFLILKLRGGGGRIFRLSPVVPELSSGAPGAPGSKIGK